MFNDDRLVYDKYETIVHDATTLGCYSGMMHLLAASAALKTPIQTYCPPTSPAGSLFLSESLTKIIRGRGVGTAKMPEVTLMWTTSFIPENVFDFRPNHFVVLIEKADAVTVLVESDDSCNEFESSITLGPSQTDKGILVSTFRDSVDIENVYQVSEGINVSHVVETDTKKHML